MSQITDLQKHINEWAVRKEWRGPKAVPRHLSADFALFHSEVSEALEEIRKNPDPKHVWFSYTVTFKGVEFKNLNVMQCEALGCTVLTPKFPGLPHDVFAPNGDKLSPKPEGVGPEMADLMIRVLETAEEYGLDMDYEIQRKMAYNEGREIRHGGLLL